MKVSLISVAAVILIASVAAEEHPALRATGVSSSSVSHFYTYDSFL